MNFCPFGLRFAFCRQILAYFDELYQQIHGCLSLTRYFDGNRKKQSVCVMSTLDHEGRRSIEFHHANYDNPIASQNKSFRKFQAALYFRKIFGSFCLDIDKKTLLLPYYTK